MSDFVDKIATKSKQQTGFPEKLKREKRHLSRDEREQFGRSKSNWPNRLTGVLPQYSVDIVSYDWACENGVVNEQLVARTDSDLIGSFISAFLQYFHLEDVEPEFCK